MGMDDGDSIWLPQLSGELPAATFCQSSMQ